MSRRKRIMLLITGSIIMGIAYKSVYDSAGLITGGFTGLAIIVKNITMKSAWFAKAFNIEEGIPLWVTTLLLNIPVFIIAFKVKGRKFVMDTLIATVTLTLALAVLPTYNIESNDLLLAAIYGGVLGGIGLGLVIMSMATTGGTDLIAAIIQNYVKHYSVARIMQIIDGAIVVAGAAVLGIRSSLYAVIAIYITTLVSDGLIDGLKFAKCVYIISDRPEEISTKIMEMLQRGITQLNGIGGYSRKEKRVLMCVVSRKESVLLKELVENTDDNAFVIVSDVREVLGEGFVKFSQKSK